MRAWVEAFFFSVWHTETWIFVLVNRENDVHNVKSSLQSGQQIYFQKPNFSSKNCDVHSEMDWKSKLYLNESGFSTDNICTAPNF